MPGLAGLSAWLTTKLGAFFGAIVFFVVQKVGGAIWARFVKWWNDFMRKRAQEEALEKVEEAVQESKPRDEKTRKEEEEWINS